MGSTEGLSRPSAEDAADGRPEGLDIRALQHPELSEHEALFDRRDYWLDHRRLQQSSVLPLVEQDVGRRSGALRHLTRHRHDDDVRPAPMIGIRADDDGWPFFRRGLVGEWKGHENDVTELTV